MRRLLPVLAALALLAALPSAASADVPENADYFEAYIETPGEPTLHVDVLRPKGFSENDKSPVILSIGPYFGHAEDPTAPNLSADPPSDRFDDMIEGGKVFERGYTVVYVDLRGFGASHGCNDFGGRGEQIDTKRAVEWAASQPWSTGKVGMWGKSYDGWTQVMALDEKPKGLAATIIQAPIIDGYRTLYQAGVHYELGWYITPGLYQAYDAMPPTTNDNADYLLSYVQGTNPACYGQNIAMQNATVDRDDPTGFWAERDLVNARGSDVPVLWSHGFLDANTKPDNFLSVWETLTGPSRAWFGQYDHIRGNEADLVGRDGFMAEAMRWLDRYVKGDTSIDVNQDPRTEIQEGDGRWRAEDQWPPADAAYRVVPVREGTYVDDDSNTAGGSASATGNGIWSFTQPAPHDLHISGLPKMKLDVVNGQAPRANLISILYDIAPDGEATYVTRGAIALEQSTEPQNVEFELYPNDYRIKAGHRLGVLVSGSDESWYTPPHSQAEIEVRGGGLMLPFLRYERSKFLPGQEAAAMAGRPVTEVEDDMGAASVTADFPPAMIPGGPPSKGGVNSPPAGKPKAAKLRISRKMRKGRRLDIKVKGAGTMRVKITVKKGRKTVARKTVRPKKGVARLRVKLSRKGTYVISAAARGKGAPKSAKRRIRVK